jgi:SnoaL-like domain
MADRVQTPTLTYPAPAELERIWQTYVAAWNDPDPDAKRSLLGAAVAADCTYTDPLSRCSGWDELITAMLDFHRQVPGARFVTSRFLAHSGSSVATWQMCNTEGVVIGDGISLGQYDVSGKLRVLTGFYEVPNG